jgi:aspartyl-tRNA(Asn)/glutamyl-tRNA(Gln) amidotransferase subunit A
MAVAGEDVWGLNAYNHLVSLDMVSEQATESDDRRRNEETLSIFDGIPVSIKSNIAERSLPLTAGSAMLGYNGYNYNYNYNYRNDGKETAAAVPACSYDADTVRILFREKGGICMGSTSMDEFGMGSLGTNVPRVVGKDGEQPPRYVKNPLPLLRHLRLDDTSDEEHNNNNNNNNTVVVVGEGRTGSTRSSDYEDDERWAAILQLSPERIAEKHREALESFQIHNNTSEAGNDDTCFYSAGGSSSGSAASVAHGSSLLSLGTDTGGSVRLPAAWCGLVGLKPSYGLLSRHGVVSYASSFDTVGVLANSVDCAAAALDVLAQRNTEFSRDSTFSCYHDDDGDDFSELAIAQSMMVSEDGDEDSAANNDHGSLSGITVGIPASFSVEECPEEIRESWSKAADELQRHGAEIVEISTESISPELVQRALSAYYVLVSAEASSNLSRYDGFRYGVTAKLGENVAATALNSDDGDGDGDDDMEAMTPLERQYAASRRQGFGAEVSKRVLCGASVLSSDKFHTHYEAAAKLRAALANEMSSVLDEQADVLLIPTVLSLPPRIDNDTGKQQQSNNNTAMFANDVMTVPASLAGLPAISIPVPITGEETFIGGMQLITSRLNESVLLKSAKALQ